ncbi:MAG: hypothetical protein ACI35O_12000 [Bacillaceae bacterium]
MKLKRNLSNKWINKLKDYYFVGCYVGEALILREDGKVESDNHVLKIKCLSPIPEKLITFFNSYQFVFSCTVFQSINEETIYKWVGKKEGLKMEEVTAFLENKHVLFQLYEENGQLLVQLVDYVPCYQEEYYFIIPSPILRQKLKQRDLEYRLHKGYLPISFMTYNNEFPAPSIIYYEGKLYGNIRLKSSVNAYTFVSILSSALYIDITKEWDNIFTFHIHDVYYLRSSVYNKLVRDVVTGGERIQVEEDAHLFFWQEEMDFLAALQANLENKQIYLDEKDTVNFHVSLKTNNITMLCGPPGIGKSSLAQIYGSTLGMKVGKELLVVPVSPSYSEPMDILGYLHPETNTYMVSETGIVPLLYEAQENTETLYMVLFEEMNLSQIEFWFSPFISILEQNPEERYLRLYSDKEEQGLVHIGDNVMFVGTINMDDTTKSMSPRFLDRVNMIELKPLSFKEMAGRLIEGKVEERTLISNVMYTQYRHEWIRENSRLSFFTEEELQLFDQINSVFRKYLFQDGVSFRSAMKMAHFMNNIPNNEQGEHYFSRLEALDIQLRQRILSKLTMLRYDVGMIDAPLFIETLHGLLASEECKNISSFSSSLQFLVELKSLLESR